MIVRVIERVGNVNIQSRVVRVVRVYDRNIPSGITVDTLTEAGSLIVASAANTPSETGAPTADGQAWISDLAEPLKGRWQAIGGGGGTAELTNKSGSNQVAGTVVIFDADNNEAFKTTTILQDRRVVGVLSEDINNNAAGDVYIGATKATVKVQGNVSRGQWLIASATEGRAQAGGYTKPLGAIGIALTAYAGGGAGTVTALIAVDHYQGAGASKGYALGGSNNTPAAVTTAQVLTMASETVAVVAGAALGAVRSNCVGAYTTDKGIVYGGTTTTLQSGGQVTAYRTTFSTDATAAVVGANLGAAKTSPGSVSAPLAAYISGGMDTTNYVTSAYKTPWATETTAAQSSANLSSARAYLGNMVHSTTNGYMAGGNSSAVTDRLVISTETTAALTSANLSASRESSTGLKNTTQGYWSGGLSGGAVTNTTDKMPFSTETTAAVGGAALSSSRKSAASASGTSGYVLGGSTSTTSITPGSPVSTTDKVNFSTDTTAAASGANLSTALSSMASMTAE